jgi:hypothetical protein
MLAMFKIWAFLALVAPFASALDITSIVGNFVTGGSLLMTWTTTASDPTSFSVELFHASFQSTYAIATNVVTSTLSKTMVIPEVPAADEYWIQIVDIFDVNTVYSTSKIFSVGADNTTESLTVGESATPTGKTSTNVPISTKPLPSSSADTTTATTPASASTSAPTSASAAGSAGSAAPSTASTGAAFTTRSVPGALIVALCVVAGAFAL